jgi:peptidyl-prolyl cis-trans isomerase A (cyclophilin A)
MHTFSWFLARAGIFVLLFATGAAVGCKKDAGKEQNQYGATAAQGVGDPAARDAALAEQQRRPRLKIATSLGDIVVRLDAEKTPLTVNNFVRYADERYYDGTIFHEVNRGYAVMGGGRTEDLSQKPVHVSVRNEANNGLKNVRGTIAMARDPGIIDSATSVFFINLADSPHLDHRDDTPEGYGYCVFGKVVEGMDVADRIGEVEVREAKAQDGSTLPRVPVAPVLIKSIRLLP